ncbi:hypothetical protein N5912_03565 [Arcobacter lacus]|uniref:hypothetical protein n=1 Tax=Arcobacter lacus TaxID=1912876 RepID=UPI0021BA41AD|nr:hypothetical protein [Arcobacter lacus]MCT7910894.1 hypothetical protein [Arcobacter lacus]
MNKLFFFLLFLTISLWAVNLEIQKAFAVGIFHENETGENVQHTTTTTQDYNGTCYTKIVILGDYNKNTNVQVKIGDSIGVYQSYIPIYNKLTKKIFAYELTFKHQNVSKGYFEVKVNNKLYDSKVFVK